MENKEEHRSLKDFSVQQRFGIGSVRSRYRDDRIAFLERTLKASVSGRPYLIIVHNPYPEPAQRETIRRGEEIPYALSGRGVGKTALLEAFVDVAKTVDGCEVLAFLDNREKLTDGDNFFEDFFVAEVLKQRLSWKDTSFFYNLASTFRRLGLVVRTSALMLGAFLTWLLSVLGLEIIKYFYDPKVQSGVNKLIQTLSQHRGWVWIAGPMLLIGWWLYFSGERDANQELNAAYLALGPISLMESHRKSQRERLLASPENLLSYLGRRKCCVLVVDDVDYLDSRSFDSILDLFQAVQDSNRKYRACIVLSFNPRNPLLWFPERARIRELLSEEAIRGPESWLPICITPLDLEQLIEILCNYFRDSTPEKLIEVIGREDPEALQRTGQLLGFFVWLETVLTKEQRSLEEVQEEELLNEFQRYIYRDEREVEQIIHAIRAQDNTGGALEFLKFMLAFQKYPVRVEFLERLLAEEGYNDPGLYERMLQSAPVRLVCKGKNGYWHYEFREAYLKYRFLTGWGEWKDQSAYYFTRVFDLLCSYKIWEAEQALKSEPSKAAIEILYSQALYFYQYFGHSDAGYALRFLGLEKGGAAGKWLSLCEARVHEGKDLWDQVYWRPSTFLNPYRHYRTSRSPWRLPVGRDGWFFAPDLLINTATAYWLIGHTQTALDLLTNKWQWVKSHLSSNYPNHWSDKRITNFSNYFKEADAEIDLLVARIRHHLGIGESWAMAIERCRPYIRGELPADQQQLALARFIAGNIRHYRHFAIGKLLSPLRFEPDGKTLEELLNVGVDKTADDLVRLRALYTVSSSIWDSCLKAPMDAREVIRSGIPFENVDREQLDRLRQIIGEAIALLKEVRSRPKARPQDVPPGGRVAEAEFFFWEAVFLYQTCLLLASDIGCTVTQYRPTLDGGRWHTRLQVYDSLARLCIECVNYGLFSSEKQTSMLDRIFKFRDWIEDLLGESASDVKFGEVKRRLDDLYVEVLNDVARQATAYFLAADAIYRRLSHQQGHAEVLFQRGLMQFLTGSELDRTPWYELLMNSDQVTGELGFHLDRLYSHLTVAQAAEASNLFASISGYQNSMPWCLDIGPGLPRVIIGEVSYRLGHQFLVVEQVRGAQENALVMMEEAHRRYEPHVDGAAFITQEDAFERMVDIRWSIAELTRRKAARLTLDDESRVGLLNRVEENCNWIINRTKEKAQFRSKEMSARAIKADSARLREDPKTAVQELGVAVEYYEREKDEFWLLQTLVMMCETIRSSKEARESLKDSEIVDYLNRLVRAAIPYVERFEKDHDSLRVVEKSIFFCACTLLGEVHYQHDRTDIAVRWLFTAFDLLTSLGIFGNAILLDDIIRRFLAVHKDEEDQKAYEERLVQASQQINPKSEDADWQRVGAILRGYFPVRITATAHLQEKRDCLRMSTAMIELENVKEAIGALERGIELIERDNPEDVDFELLVKLREAYRIAGNHEKVADVNRQRQELKDIAQSRDFLQLAEKYLEKDLDAQWALEVATDVSFRDSQWYRRAKRLLDELCARTL